MARRNPSPKESAAAAEAGKAVARKRELAPRYTEIAAAFPGYGERGYVRENGRVVGYRYPKSRNPERQQRINRTVFELWNPHRRADMNLGAELNANVATVRARDASGRERRIPEAMVGRSGLEPVAGRRPNLIYRNGQWWRYLGADRWEAA